MKRSAAVGTLIAAPARASSLRRPTRAVTWAMPKQSELRSAKAIATRLWYGVWRGADRFDQEYGRVGRQHPAQGEAGRSEQRAKLVERALAAAVHHHHVDVGECRFRRGVTVEQPLDQQHGSWSIHGPVHSAQDADRILVVPVVEHARQQVAVATPGHRLEEVAGHRLRRTSAGEAIEDDSFRIRIGLQQSGHERTVAAAYIDNAVESGKIVGA